MEHIKEKPIMKRFAVTDITYCVNKTCENKCWRHEDNNIFSKDRYYSFTDKCINRK